jgi:undecaprenyl diphosphate synthase
MVLSADPREAPDRSGGDGPRMPKHVGIIMDGNGRWAAQRGLSRTEGHKRGVEAVRETLRAAAELGIEYLTLFSFSSENWSRPPAEVQFLFGLLRVFIRSDLATLHDEGVRIRVIGERKGIPADIAAMLEEAEKLTAANKSFTLVVAFNYGGRDEIARAVKGIARDAASGKLDPEKVDETTIASRLDTAGIPDPDLIIRTSGELRLSNFLLWQSAYAELVFLPIFWPDFNCAALHAAVTDYARRERRYGGVAASRGR